MDKALTVITYVTTGEKYLHRCLKGLEQQKIPFKWLLLCNDEHEKTETELDVDCVILPKKCINKAAAYNFILPQIKTKYIAYNDADDISLPNRLQKQMEFLDANMEIDILGGQLIINEKHQGWKVYKIDTEIRAFMLLNNPMVNSTIMLRNKIDFWGKTVNYNKEFKRAEDYEFWFECLKADLTFANLNIPLISYLKDADRPADLVQMSEAESTRERVFAFYAKKPIDPRLAKLYHQFANKEKLDSTQIKHIKESLLEIFLNHTAITNVLNEHQAKPSWWQKIKNTIS